MSYQQQQYPPPQQQYGQQQQQYYPPPPQSGGQYGQQQYQQQPYGQTPQPQYAPPPQQYVATQQPQHQQPHGSYEELLPKKESRFKTGEYKDLWATILWIVFVLGFAGISAVGIPNLSKANTTSSTTTPSTSTSTESVDIPPAKIGVLIALSAVVGFALSLTYFYLLQRFAGKLIKASLIVSVAVTALFGVFMLYYGQFVAGIIWLLFAAIYAWCFYSWRHRIPFASAMLKAIASVTQKYPALLGVGVGGLILQFAFICWWVLTLTGIGIGVQNKQISDNAAYFMYVYTLFTFYWTSQVIGNGVHITVSGVFATFYFRGVAQPNGTVDVPVSNPTVASLKRACTTSLGPNCYGSLLIAIIQTLKALADNARNDSANNDNIVCTLILCCLSCILALVRDLLEYFNKYAFAQVAIYGKDYCTAAKDTWALTKARGIDAIINDSLIGSVLSMGGLFIGLVTAGAAALFVFASKDITGNALTYIIVSVIAFFIGIVEFSVLANVIDSGVVTTFVCLAEDPLALAQTKPALYQKIQQVYPQVVLGF